MAERRATALLEQMFFVERFTLTRAWSGLTDAEFFLEPTPDCWGVRPASETRTPDAWLAGDWVADSDFAATDNYDPAVGEPLTTIGWLYWHVGTMPGRAAQLDFLGGDHTAESGWSSPYLAGRRGTPPEALHPIFTTADDAVTTMQAGWRALEAALQPATDDQLEAPVRFWGYGGPGRMGTGAQILTSIMNEISHHGTQIGVLRDFYRVRDRVS